MYYPSNYKKELEAMGYWLLFKFKSCYRIGIIFKVFF
jgi:hypothetical protein